MVEGTARAAGCTATLEYTRYYPATVNDPMADLYRPTGAVYGMIMLGFVGILTLVFGAVLLVTVGLSLAH